MRKLSISLAIIFLVGLMASAERYVWEGKGTVLTVTTNPVVVRVDSTNYCYSASVCNPGTNTVYVSIGTNATGFIATNAMPIPAGWSYTTPGGDQRNELTGRKIYGVIISTTTNSSSAAVTFK